jgi:hypothetical protein
MKKQFWLEVQKSIGIQQGEIKFCNQIDRILCSSKNNQSFDHVPLEKNQKIEELSRAYLSWCFLLDL